MSHLLNIEIPSIGSTKVLRIYDTSVWDSALSVTRRKLDIIPPGFTSSVTFTLQSGFDRLFNSSNLQIIVVSDPKDLADLPDGIYVVRLTVEQPSGDQWVEFNHLRQSLLLKDFYKAKAALNIKTHDLMDEELQRDTRELDRIESYIKAAKAKVEWVNAPKEGIALQQYARKRLDKYRNQRCKT